MSSKSLLYKVTTGIFTKLSETSWVTEKRLKRSQNADRRQQIERFQGGPGA